MRKYIVFLATVLLFLALLSGCRANTDNPDNSSSNALPEVPVAELITEFEKRLYQETESDSGRVVNFATKEQWVQHMSEIMDEHLARLYADEYYYEENNGLYLIPQGGPAMLILDQPYETNEISEGKVQVTQTGENVMFGKYALTVTFAWRDDRWIIQAHEFQSMEGNEGGALAPAEAAAGIAARAEQVINLIAEQDMAALADFTHPVKGIRFSPYSYVDVKNHVVFKPSDLKTFFTNSAVYHWGSYDGTGEPISLTPAAYYQTFIYDQDYRNAGAISYNEQLFQGNMINNAPDVYPGAIIVEYHFDGFDAKYGGLDWRSLRLIFEADKGEWLLVGIIHDQWTI